MILEARSATVRYRGRVPLALDRVSCQVGTSELVAVVGPNGSGKTTLVRAMLGLLPLEHGAVLVDSRPVSSWSRPQLARIVGVVGQQEEAVFRLTVAETVMLGRYAHLGPLAQPRDVTRPPFAQPCNDATSSSWRSGRSTACLVGSGSAFAWLARWHRSLGRWCWMSPPRRWTSGMRWSSSSSFVSW